MAELERTITFANSVKATPDELAAYGLKVNRDGVRRSALDLLAYPQMSVENLAKIWPEFKNIGPEIAEQLEIKGKYSGYMDRQENDIKAFRKDESLKLPTDLDYREVGGLSNEIIMKLGDIKPPTLGAAARVSGVTPAALTALLGHVRRAARSAT